MAKAKVIRFPVTERALVQRINRKLAGENEQIRKWRSGQWKGYYFHLDVSHNMLLSESFNDIESFARELGVMEKWETLDESPNE